METFVYVQTGELYTYIDAETEEEAREKLDSMSREQIKNSSEFKTRDSYWM